MTTRLSSKGQVVLPKQVRMRLQLRPGMKFMCKVQGRSLILTPESTLTAPRRSVSDVKTGLVITKSPVGTRVTSGDVRAALVEFP